MLNHCFSFLLACSLLSADWNSDFDASTEELIEVLPELAQSDYLSHYAHFQKIRSKLVRDNTVLNRIQPLESHHKCRIIKKPLGTILKKRRCNHIHEAYIWEVACLLGASAYVVPSFPIDLNGTKVIVQPLESFEDGTHYSKRTLRKISVATYWKAHILAYLLGLGDLVCANIGVEPKTGQIRFFDTEGGFGYCNTPYRNDISFSAEFLCQSFDWAHFTTPLDPASTEEIRQFLNALLAKAPLIPILLRYRLPELDLTHFDPRVRTLAQFSLHEGLCFRDFFSACFPRLNAGLDALKAQVNRLAKQPIGYGTTFILICRETSLFTLSSKERTLLNQWIQDYVD